MNIIAVSYIGKSPTWIDNAYGSGLIFEQYETYRLPENIAKKLLRHSDCFEINENGGSSSSGGGEYDDTLIKRRLTAVEITNNTQTREINELQSDLVSNTDADTALCLRVEELESDTLDLSLTPSDIDAIIYGA